MSQTITCVFCKAKLHPDLENRDEQNGWVYVDHDGTPVATCLRHEGVKKMVANEYSKIAPYQETLAIALELRRERKKEREREVRETHRMAREDMPDLSPAPRGGPNEIL